MKYNHFDSAEVLKHQQEHEPNMFYKLTFLPILVLPKFYVKSSKQKDPLTRADFSCIGSVVFKFPGCRTTRNNFNVCFDGFETF